MSMADLRHCLTFDVGSLEGFPDNDVMTGLHAAVVALAGNEDEMEEA